ncbi:MAG: glucose-1-phosphate cytidylyltransferase [Candidatus Lokiarchaeota archaeon]|nr:glucose-1-phosphate cytidylyltransferase [Candidatus Lokiarchaeota archaeon]
MKVVILAGGWGTRLGNYTEFIPKPMVRIGSQPIIWHIMKIYAHQGFKDFIICLGVKGNVIKDYFAHYELEHFDCTVDLKTMDIQYFRHEETDWKVTLAETGLNTLKGGRIKRVEKYLDPGVNMLTYGDGVSDIDLKAILKFHKSHGKMVTITAVNLGSKFGEIDEKDGKVISFKEKPKISPSLVNGGFMVFNKEMLDYLTDKEDCDFEIGALDKLAEMGEVMAYKHRGFWACMDHERDVAYLTDLWNKNKAPWKIW